MKVKIIKAHDLELWYNELGFIGNEFEVREFSKEEILTDPTSQDWYEVIDDSKIFAIDNDSESVAGYMIHKNDCEIKDEDEEKYKFAILQKRDTWCERISEHLAEDDRKLQVKVDRDLEGYWLFCAYTNGKMFEDFICQEEVKDVAADCDDYPNDEEMALLCCVGWRVDEFKKQGYKGDWLEENE